VSVRRTLFWAWIAWGAILLLLAVGVLVVRTEWFSELVRVRIIAELERHSGGRIAMGAYSFNWRNLTAELRDLVLRGREAPADPPLFRAASVKVGLRILSVLRREVNIESLVLEKPALHIRIYEDGRTNLPEPEVFRRQDPLEKWLALAVGNFQIHNGWLQVNDQRTPLEAEGEDFLCSLAYDPAGRRQSGKLSFRRLRLTAAGFAPPAFSADASLLLEPRRLVLRRVALSSDASQAEISGTVEDLLRAPRAHLTISSRLALTELLAAARAGDFAAGDLNLKGEFSYLSGAGYDLRGRISSTGLTLGAGRRRISVARLASNLFASPAGIELEHLSALALGGRFNGVIKTDAQGSLLASGQIEKLKLSELTSVSAVPALPWDGLLSGPVSLEGVLRNSRLTVSALSGKLSIDPAETGAPVRGNIELTAHPNSGSVEFGDSYLAGPTTEVRLASRSDRQLSFEIVSRDYQDLAKAVAFARIPLEQLLPAGLSYETARLSGILGGGLESPRASGRLEVSNLNLAGHRLERVTAEYLFSEAGLYIRHLLLQRGSARIEGDLRAELNQWRLEEASAISAELTFKGLPLEELAAEIKSALPAAGTLAGRLRLGGTRGRPQLSGRLEAAAGALYGRRFESLQTVFAYAPGALRIESLEARVAGQGRLHAGGAFRHAPDNWRNGELGFEITAQGVALDLLRPEIKLPEILQARLELQLRGKVSVNDAELRLSALEGKLSAARVLYSDRPAGSLELSVENNSGQLRLAATGEFFGSKLRGTATGRLQGAYPFTGEISFSRITWSRLKTALGEGVLPNLQADIQAGGVIYFSGSALEPASWRARLELPGVEILPPPGIKTAVHGLRSAGVVVLAATRKTVRVVSASFAGPDMSVNITGGMDLSNRQNMVDLRLRGRIDLSFINGLEPGITAAGDSLVEATIRGPWPKPEFYGRLEFKKASLNLSDLPNGLEDASGVILLYRDRAVIEQLRAQTGGGTLTISGYVGFSQRQMTYRLQAKAAQVRVRYPEGVSTTLDAAVNLTGTSSRSLLSGTVTVLRSAVSPGVDLAAALTRTSQPLVTPAATNELLRGMQLDVRIAAAPNARFDTVLTRDVQIEAAMRLRGTPTKPVLLGRVTVNQGEVNFLGTRYTISRGELSFLNPARLEPVLSLDLETRVRGVDVTLSLTGPPDRLSLSYRSDPPLEVQEIIALLAVGRAPSADPAVLARQAQQDQSWQQIGAGSLVGQVLAAPVAGRLQRFFGVSRIKIDPQLTGLGNNPEAQLTLEQQISRDITLTYVTNLAQEQQQLVRVEWNLSRQWSLVAVRDENGLFSLEVQYRRQLR